ncbi:hypothetical protein CsatB_003695 [Cannabis sativa]
MSLYVETPKGQDVFALEEISVSNSIGIFKKASKPLVINGEAHQIPFSDNTFYFVFSGDGRLEKSPRLLDFALEIVRTLKLEGYAVVHIGAKDTHIKGSMKLLNKDIKKVVGVERMIMMRKAIMVVGSLLAKKPQRQQHKEPVIRRAVVPLRLAGTREFGIEVRARLKLRSRESEKMKIVHVGVVRSGAYNLWDIEAFAV